jgi:hypothetical protein
MPFSGILTLGTMWSLAHHNMLQMLSHLFIFSHDHANKCVVTRARATDQTNTVTCNRRITIID